MPGRAELYKYDDDPEDSARSERDEFFADEPGEEWSERSGSRQSWQSGSQNSEEPGSQVPSDFVEEEAPADQIPSPENDATTAKPEPPKEEPKAPPVPETPVKPPPQRCCFFRLPRRTKFIVIAVPVFLLLAGATALVLALVVFKPATCKFSHSFNVYGKPTQVHSYFRLTCKDRAVIGAAAADFELRDGQGKYDSASATLKTNFTAQANVALNFVYAFDWTVAAQQYGVAQLQQALALLQTTSLPSALPLLQTSVYAYAGTASLYRFDGNASVWVNVPDATVSSGIASPTGLPFYPLIYGVSPNANLTVDSSNNLNQYLIYLLKSAEASMSTNVPADVIATGYKKVVVLALVIQGLDQSSVSAAADVYSAAKNTKVVVVCMYMNAASSGEADAKTFLGKICKGGVFSYTGTSTSALAAKFTEFNDALLDLANGWYALAFCSPRRKGTVDLQVRYMKTDKPKLKTQYSCDGFDSQSACTPLTYPAPIGVSSAAPLALSSLPLLAVVVASLLCL